MTLAKAIARIAAELRARPIATAYGAAIAGTAVVAAVAAILRVTASAPPYLLFAPVVCGAALFAGLGPGLAATALAARSRTTTGMIRSVLSS